MRKLFAVFALLVVAGVACNNEASDTGTVATPPPSVSPAATTAAPGASPKINDHGTKTFTTQNFSLEVELDNDGDDYYFSPTFIKSPGGATAKIELHNEGSIPHTFTIDALKVDQEVAPDATKEITVNIGTETRYEFYCRFHKDLGMRGAFQPH